MKTRISVSALALIAAAGMASADTNQAYVDQNGTGNTLSIDQSSGSGNQAGKAPDGGNLDAITQNGNDNAATILQVGDNNIVGVNANGSASQIGDDNIFSITQQTDSNVVSLVRQNSLSDGSGATENTLTVLQGGGNGNRVGFAGQGNTGGDVNAMTITQTGTSNRVVDRIVQYGEGNSAVLTQTGDSNRVTALRQGKRAGTDIDSDDNTAQITQTGNGNVVVNLDQFGDLNSADLDFEGDGNGSTALTGVAAVATDSSVLQTGMSNSATLEVTGDYNAFGVAQTGNANTIGTVAILGDGNQFGAAQTGDENELLVTSFIGDDNIVGVTQNAGFPAGGNLVTLALVGNGNLVDLDQDSNKKANRIYASVLGDTNDLTINQTTGASDNASSVATVDIDGNSNHLNVQQNSQRSAGGPQTVDISITGDFNNNAGVFTGDALTAAGLLNPGDIVQERNGSDVTIDVIGSSNLFATYQSGNPGSSISGTINGNFNQAAVRQVGTANSTTFAQNGNYNVLGVKQ